MSNRWHNHLLALAPDTGRYSDGVRGDAVIFNSDQRLESPLHGLEYEAHF